MSHTTHSSNQLLPSCAEESLLSCTSVSALYMTTHTHIQYMNGIYTLACTYPHSSFTLCHHSAISRSFTKDCHADWVRLEEYCQEGLKIKFSLSLLCIYQQSYHQMYTAVLHHLCAMGIISMHRVPYWPPPTLTPGLQVRYKHSTSALYQPPPHPFLMPHTHAHTHNKHLLLSRALLFVYVNVALAHTLQGVTDYVRSQSIISRTDADIIGEPVHSGSCEIILKAGRVCQSVTKDTMKEPKAVRW